LERECYNFFGLFPPVQNLPHPLTKLDNRFVKDEIVKRQEADQNVNSVAFEELIPLSDSRIVAAQAFSHTLLLATRDLLKVRQGELFGAIQISLV
jgi:chromatin segregation and condensation protein Rec8/ScpA/Scc1 (kleisin family)